MSKPRSSLRQAGLAARALPALALLTIAAPASAEDGLRLSGSMRVRAEWLGGQARAALPASESVVSQRTSFVADYADGPFSLGVELQDSRVYGDEPGGSTSTNEANAFEFIQAWGRADLGDLLGTGSKSSVQAGRFTLNIGSRRLVALNGYRNTTNAFTGVRFDVAAPSKTRATLFFTLPQVRLPEDQPSLLDDEIRFDRESFDLIFFGGLLTRPRLIGDATLDIGYFRLIERDRPDMSTRNRHLHTIDLRLYRDPAPGRFDFDADVMLQRGSIRASTAASAARQDVDAWLLHLHAGYQWAVPWKPRVVIGYDRVSGDGPGAAKFGRFDGLFGARGQDFGPSGIFAAVGRANISAPFVKIEAVPSDRLDLTASYRPLSLEDATDSFATSRVRDASGASSDFAGHYVEARARWWAVPKRLRLETNAAYIAKGRFLRTAPNAVSARDARYLAVAGVVLF